MRGGGLRLAGLVFSHNGLGLNSKGIVNMALIQQVLHVNVERQYLRIWAVFQTACTSVGPRNYASVVEQEVDGEVGAHSTDVSIANAHEQELALKMVKPDTSALNLTESDDAK